MPQFEDFGALKLLAQRIKNDVDAYSVWLLSQDDIRTHLGASEIGEPCWRRVWLKWRWAKKERFDGRMLRLFKRGHVEEEKFIELLRGVGFTVWEIDPGTGKQWRILGVAGHFGGSSDGFGALPLRYEFPAATLLLEYKTHNDKSFKSLLKSGVMIAKPQHWAQMCAYGYKKGVQYVLYCAVNKNDDDLHFEVLKLDLLLGADTERKAEELINARTPPRKIAESPAFHECKYCHLSPICFEGERPEKNCRTCLNITPVDDGKWLCRQHNIAVDLPLMQVGCDDWKAIING